MRFLPADPALRWGLAAAAGWTALCVIVTAIPEGPPPSNAPPSPPPPPPVPTPPPIAHGWVLLGTVFVLRHGARYRGCIKLPWIAPHFSVAAVKARAEAEGFRDVVVVDRPSDECEYLVEATWGQDAKTMQRPSVVVAAWEQR